MRVCSTVIWRLRVRSLGKVHTRRYVHADMTSFLACYSLQVLPYYLCSQARFAAGQKQKFVGRIMDALGKWRPPLALPLPA